MLFLTLAGVRANLVDPLTLADFCLFHLNACAPLSTPLALGN